jgi:hypothetical protein
MRGARQSSSHRDQRVVQRVMWKFWTIASAILAWNLIGDAAYLMQATSDFEAMSKVDPVSADAFNAMPPWAWGAYALAVGGGTLGAALLLMRRKAAWAFFALSVAGIVVQFGWTFLGYGLILVKGWSSAVFPAMILAIALASLFYARAKAADGSLR